MVVAACRRGWEDDANYHNLSALPARAKIERGDSMGSTHEILQIKRGSEESQGHAPIGPDIAAALVEGGG